MNEAPIVSAITRVAIGAWNRGNPHGYSHHQYSLSAKQPRRRRMPNISSKVSTTDYLTGLIIGMWGRRVQGPMTHELRAMSYVYTGGLLSAWAGRCKTTDSNHHHAHRKNMIKPKNTAQFGSLCRSPKVYTTARTPPIRIASIPLRPRSHPKADWHFGHRHSVQTKSPNHNRFHPTGLPQVGHFLFPNWYNAGLNHAMLIHHLDRENHITTAIAGQSCDFDEPSAISHELSFRRRNSGCHPSAEGRPDPYVIPAKLVLVQTGSGNPER